MSIFVCVFLVCFVACTAWMTFDVTHYGARGDNKTEDTHAFEAAIAAVAKHSSGRVLVPGPGVYLIRPINLTSNIEFYIQGGAIVVGVADSAKWPLIPAPPSYGQGRDTAPGSLRFTSLIHGENLENVTIQGDGHSSILDGQGWYWWPQKHRLKSTRGHLLELMYSNNIRIYDIAMRDSPFWTNHFLDCENVHVWGVSVKAAPDSKNTDGWDPDSARNVLIEDSTYDGGDDCVAIKSGWDCYGVQYGKPSVNITIRNLTCHGHLAGIAIGSEMSGGIENVLVENIKFTKANGAAHIKTGPSRGGYVKNVVFKDMVVEGPVDQAVFVVATYKDVNPSCPSHWKPPLAPMSNYSFINIDGRKATVNKNTFTFLGLGDMPITGMYLENVRFTSGALSPDWLCGNVSGTVKRNTIEPWPPCAEMKPSDEVERLV